MPVWNKITDAELALITERFLNTEMRIEDIARELGRSYFSVHRTVHTLFSKEQIKARKRISYRNSKLAEKNPMSGKFREQHHNYKGGCVTHGYKVVLKPDWYTSRKTQKHVFEHHVVVCEAFGITEIPKGYMVHHCNGDKLDNRFCNLVLLTTAAHTKLHAALRRGIEGATTISKESTLKWVEAHGGGLWKSLMI